MKTRRSLYLRWVAANTLGEMVGLGATFAVGFFVLAQAGESQGPTGSMTRLLLMTASGLLEGLIVGLCQWTVLRRVFSLGLILALPQWWVLRQIVDRAWGWLPANGVAWALGMPLVFAAVDLAYQAGTVWGSVVVMVLALVLTGAVVGAVHGLAVVWLAARATESWNRF
jgi:hypothetical protein